MSERKTEFNARDRWLTFAFLAGPIAVLTHLTVSYALVPESCARGSKTMLHASSAAFFIVAAIAMLIGWHYYRESLGVPRREEPLRGTPRNSEEPEELRMERTRWLSLAAMVLSVFSAVVIVAMEISNVILRSCD